MSSVRILDVQNLDGAAANAGANNLTVAHLSGLNADETMDAVRKEAIWPQPDWRAMISEGVQPQAAALIKLIRDRLPSKPNYGTKQIGTHYSQRTERQPELMQKDYVRMIGLVRDHLQSCRTVENVRAARAGILKAAGWHERVGAETKHLVMSVWRDRMDTMQLDYRDMMNSETMIQQGWPGSANPSWRKGYAVRGDGEGGYLLAKGVRVLQDGFLTTDAAWDWLREQVDERKNHTAILPIPSRPTLNTPVRHGLHDWRKERDVEILELMDVFGLRAIEFGKWVPQPERQDLLNRAFDALHDLAGALGIPCHTLGLQSSLAISFGARSAGSAGADYDPKLRVIAMPRSTGSGELARCWAKGFDHWSGELGLNTRPMLPRTASGRAAKGREPAVEVGHLSGAQAMAWSMVQAAVWRGEAAVANEDGELTELRQQLADVQAEITKTKDQRAAYLERNPDAQNTQQGAAYLLNTENWIATRTKVTVANLEAKISQAEAKANALPESDLVIEARKLCGRDGDYWIRPTEMFARAFEAYVYDQIQDRNACSEFLVHGVEETRFATGYRGNPFPTGKQRARLHEAMGSLIEEMAITLQQVPARSDDPAAIPPPPIMER